MGDDLVLATVLVLSSAFLHAGWNLAMKTSSDRLVFAWLQLGVAGLGGAVLLAVVGLPPRAAWPFSVAAGALHALNALVLAGAYERGDLSLVYPMSRGLAPVFTALGAAVLLGDTLAPSGYAGIAVVSVALLAMGGRGAGAAAYGWAAGAGICVAAAVLNDTVAVRGETGTLAHLGALYVVAAVLLTAVTLVRRRGDAVLAAVRGNVRAGAATGLALLVGYGLVLVALQHASVAYVATLREVSIVLGALGGWLLLREPTGVRRLAGSSAIMAGVGLLVTGA